MTPEAKQVDVGELRARLSRVRDSDSILIEKIEVLSLLRELELLRKLRDVVREVTPAFEDGGHQDIIAALDELGALEEL